MSSKLRLRRLAAVSALAWLPGIWGAAPAVAAGVPAGATAAGDPETYSPIQIVAAVLKLSDDQAHALAQIQAARAEAIAPLVQQIQLHQQQIATLLGGDNPDPAQLGRLLIETKALQAQIQMISAASASQFVSLLSDPQQQTLAHIRQASQVCPVVPAFAAVGVL